MKILSFLAVTTVCASGVISAFADTQPLPAAFQGSTTDYVVFGEGSSFPGQNLICFSAGCGGAFQGTVFGPGVSGATGPSVLTTVWCVDYQLDVTYDSAYAANITTLGDVVNASGNVRYGTLDGTGTPGWVNSVTAPIGVDANSAEYRYTLAAALVSQYEDSSSAINPTNPNGGSEVNRAIQEATWYVTYNNEYSPGATWPPEGDITAPDSCTAGGETNITNPDNYMCWVKYAEANAANVNTSQWGVISGPVLNDVLQSPQVVGGYASYQTFLVEMDSGGQNNHQGSPTPEPTYLVLTCALGGLILFARRRQAAKRS